MKNKRNQAAPEVRENIENPEAQKKQKKAKKPFFKRPLVIILLVVILFLASGIILPSLGEKKGAMSFDVISTMDASTVTSDDKYTYFTCDLPDGSQIRFCGSDITVDESGITFHKEGRKLYSLDAIGTLRLIEVSGTGFDESESEAQIGWGGDFNSGDTPALESPKDGNFMSPYGIYAKDMQDNGRLTLRYSDVYPNFLYIDNSSSAEEQIADYTITALLIRYDEPKTSDLNASDWELVTEGSEIYENLRDKGDMHFDVISCMDMSTVTSDGQYTYFTCSLPDGSKIRFCGTDITVDESGITFHRDGGNLYSLDAIGTIGCLGVTGTGFDEGEDDVQLNFGVGYTFTDTTSVESPEDAIFIGAYGLGATTIQDGTELWYEALKPNFLYVNNSPYIEEQKGDYTVTELVVHYNEAKTTGIKDIDLNPDFYIPYLEGDLYDVSREGFDVDEGALSFYLCVAPEGQGTDTSDPAESLWGVENFTIGELRDTEGNVLDKASTPLQPGYTLDVSLCGGEPFAMELPVLPPFTGAQSMHDLVPYAFPEAVGEMNVLVVPVAWSDLPGEATDANLDAMRKHIGRVVGADGTSADYSNPGDSRFSLTEYYDTASYGKLKLMPFMTDWYVSDKEYAQVKENDLTIEYGQEILDWVKKTYRDIDWTQYDKDANGYVDAMIIVNAGDEPAMSIPTIGGAAHRREVYANQYAGTPKDPNVNCYVNICLPWLVREDFSPNVLIHEFGHNLGLIDYYDVTYSGIDAVGSFDMQSQNVGDWNAYSKYAVNWIDPQVVTGLAPGQSVELEIGSLAKTGDAIVIPAAGSEYGGVFSEYMLVDLFTDDGTNMYDAATPQFNLSGVTGVRIYHVNATMEKHVEEHGGQQFDIGTIHFPNAYSETGRYNIELLQRGGTNTFTVPGSRTVLSADDLFRAGDSFSMSSYSEFFLNGKMDSGKDFGYRIDVVSITDGVATIRITAE